MSEPIRTSPAKRKQLAAALKRNMARRKAASAASVAPRGEPQNGSGQPSVESQEPASSYEGAA